MHTFSTLTTTQWNLKWCTFTEQATGPATHCGPAASGTVAPPPPIPAASGTVAPPPPIPAHTLSTSAPMNLIDFQSAAPAPIHSLMTHLNINN